MSPRARRFLPWLALLIVYVVWGSTYLAIAVVVRELPPFAAGGLRFLTAGLVMAAVAAVADRAHGRPTRRQLLDYALVGALLLGVGNSLVMWAEKSIPSGIAALIVATVPLWLTLADGLRPGGQRWTVRAWLGALVGLVGVAVIARPEAGLGRGYWLAIVALQVANLAWTAGSLYAKSVPQRLPLFTAAAVEMLAGGLVLFVESRVLGEDLGLLATASSQAWTGLAYLIVFGSLIGFTSYAYALNELPATTVGTHAYVNPVVAVALGALILSEPLSAGLLAGGALIVVAVVLTTLRVNGGSRGGRGAKSRHARPAVPPGAFGDARSAAADASQSRSHHERSRSPAASRSG
jgi:drug/metabolite transporter (DMT)-like permease